MELYLDSANLKEIEEGFKLGFLNGLTTTPTFMQKEGITDIDGTIVKLSKIVPVLQMILFHYFLHFHPKKNYPSYHPA